MKDLSESDMLKIKLLSHLIGRRLATLIYDAYCEAIRNSGVPYIQATDDDVRKIMQEGKIGSNGKTS